MVASVMHRYTLAILESDSRECGGNEFVAGAFAAEGMEERHRIITEIGATWIELEHGLGWAGAQ